MKEKQLINEIMSYLPALAEGTLETVKLFAITLVLSLPLGLPIALGVNSKFLPIKLICSTYVWIFRGTPLLLQLFFFYFFLPINMGIALDAFATAAVTFVLNYAAYFAEIYRGGFNSIDIGQFEAAHSLHLSKKQTLLDIVLPQTMKAILPSVFNETITLVKDTALVQAIGMLELMKVTYGIVNRTSATLVFLVTAIIYLMLNLILTIIAGKLETHFKRYDAKGEA